MLLKIPQNQKYKKYNRSSCFQNRKLIRLGLNKLFFLDEPYLFGLVSVEKGYLSFLQLKTLFSLVSKCVKSKRGSLGYSDRLGQLAGSNVSKSLIDFSSSNKRLFFKKFFFTFKNMSRFLVRNKIRSGFLSNRRFKKKKIIICVFPSIPLTSKSLGIRMGKGKGNIAYWHTPVKCGKILLKIRRDVHPEKALFSLKQAMRRIPFKTRIVCKDPLLRNLL